MHAQHALAVPPAHFDGHEQLTVLNALRENFKRNDNSVACSLYLIMTNMHQVGPLKEASLPLSGCTA